jgi:hypothetical protein
MLLLRAALSQGPEALAAWAQWEREEGLDRPDVGSFRLLPLVSKNLAANGYQGAQSARLRGIHRQAWSRNQVLFHQVHPFLEMVRATGTPVLLLKGAALAFQVYPDAGCRPMSDLDVLVPASSARHIWQKLESAGWRAAQWRPQELRESYFRFRHAMDFKSPEAGCVDLHWHALCLCCHSRADELFWQDPQPLEFQGIPLETCNPTAHLLNLCVHGIVWNDVPPVRWIADAVLLLRRFPSLEWGRLIEASATLDIVPYLHRALAFLRSNFDVPVPAETLSRLESAKVSAAVAAEFARESEPFAARTAREDLLAFYARWRRSLGGASPIAHSPGFLRYLAYAFDLESTSALAGQLLRSAVRRSVATPR